MFQGWVSYNLEAFQRTAIIYVQEQNLFLGPDRTNPALEEEENKSWWLPGLNSI